MAFNCFLSPKTYQCTHEPLPLASACEPPPASALLFSVEALFFVAIALCHSGIFTAAGEIPLLKGELRPVLDAKSCIGVAVLDLGVSTAVACPFVDPVVALSLALAGAGADAGVATALRVP